ncbi:hypothetical protein MKZ38_005207 [Zalerion maritima]|uniref:Uncharacterized protein n=1 Tax=Zalerion maritima TaxID=339359 RepID=A0AAD5RX33_9PEZI|nr:hypothetical protein MKZ38_005207 [Zalerion maritima]
MGFSFPGGGTGGTAMTIDDQWEVELGGLDTSASMCSVLQNTTRHDTTPNVFHQNSPVLLPGLVIVWTPRSSGSSRLSHFAAMSVRHESSLGRILSAVQPDDVTQTRHWTGDRPQTGPQNSAHSQLVGSPQ